MWTAADRAWAIALADLEADTCSCGQRISESTLPTSEGHYSVTAIRCHACAKQGHVQREFLSTGAPAALDGLRFNINKR